MARRTKCKGKSMKKCRRAKKSCEYAQGPTRSFCRKTRRH